MFREREQQSQFHDHSTLGGKLKILLNRLNWRLVPGAILLISLCIVGVVVALSRDDVDDLATESPLPMPPPQLPLLQLGAPAPQTVVSHPPVLKDPQTMVTHPVLKALHNRSPFTPNPWNPVKATPPDTFEAEGCENGLMYFEGFPAEVITNKGGIKSLKLRDLIINAPKFSKELEGFTSLESIIIENAWVSGEFSRVVLPSLKKFIYHQFHNEHTDSYKTKQMLKSILFFDKEINRPWDLEMDLLNLNITIQVTIGGTKILKIDFEQSGDAVINTHYCEDILKHYNSQGTNSISSLSLNWCPVTNKSIDSFPETLEFLQFNNAVPSNEDLATILQRLPNLRELHANQLFHCDWPGYEIYLNVSQLPDSLETVSLRNLDISYNMDMGSNGIKNLSLDAYISPGLAKNFSKVFKDLKSLALFNISAEDAYPILDQILSSSSIEWVLVTNLTRTFNAENLYSNFAMPSGFDAFVDVRLSKLGVPRDAKSFLLERQKSDANSNTTMPLIGRSISKFESNYYKFTRLAFDKVDHYDDYVIWDSDPK